MSNDEGSRWNDATLDAILATVKEAKAESEPVSLRAGRAGSHVGFNRRLVNKETGHVYMGVNRDGPIVPWVYVLIADSKKTDKSRFRKLSAIRPTHPRYQEKNGGFD